VIHALLVNSGDVQAARRYLFPGVGVTDNDNRWAKIGLRPFSYKEDLILLNGETHVIETLVADLGQDKVRARYRWLRGESDEQPGEEEE